MKDRASEAATSHMLKTLVFHLKRHPSDEDDRFDSTKFVLIFFGIVLVIMVFIPNSLWE